LKLKIFNNERNTDMKGIYFIGILAIANGLFAAVALAIAGLRALGWA
jgi:hypothetical protein